MGDQQLPPEGGLEGRPSAKKTWASVLGGNIFSRNDDNVLEVILEKDSRGAFNVQDAECANLMKRLGLDQRPGVQVLGVQICPQGRGVIYITLKKEIEIAKFCK